MRHFAMPKPPSTDTNQLAAAIVAHTTNGNGEITKNPAAGALGRLGGLKVEKQQPKPVEISAAGNRKTRGIGALD